ncbi:MAG: hypothetical protein ACJAQZ_003780, partial [Planctomycetota bacterium]
NYAERQLAEWLRECLRDPEVVGAVIGKQSSGDT